MAERRYRLLLVLTHPVQYMSPILREMAKHPKLDIVAAYCCLQGAEPGMDPEFGIQLNWDIPLLEGYQWLPLANSSLRPGLGRFWGLMNLGLWRLIRKGNFDAVVVYTGYKYVTFWIAAVAAKLTGCAFLFGTDAHGTVSLDGKLWKKRVKKWLWPHLFQLADVVIVPSSAGVKLMGSLGISRERIALTHYVVDNKWWVEQAALVNVSAVRAEWRIPDDGLVILFCAKLQPWKRPHDILRAFARSNVDGSYLVFAGDGPLRSDLEAEVKFLGLAERVRFLGFVNQTGLPRVYCSSTVLVLPSEYEAFGVVVNEAMLCGCPVILSDRVGARFDLVEPGETGFIFPASDIGALTKLLRDILPARERLKRMGDAAREQMTRWSPEMNIEGLIGAIERALERNVRLQPQNEGRK
jgi:glycosyltransferase involved in cell wall biosynthesis